MPRLSRDQRNVAIGMLAGGVATRRVAQQMGCSHSTIVRLHQRHQMTGSVGDRPRPGRERVTSRRTS